MQAIDQQPHLLRGMLQHESLRLNKLLDHALSRSALPLSRAAPTGLSRRSRSRDGSAHYGTHRLPLGGRRRSEKKKRHQGKATTQKDTKLYSPVTAPSRGGTPLSSPHRLHGRLIYRPLLDVRCRPTSRRTCKQETTAINRGSNSPIEQRCKTKEVRCTLESVCARDASSGNGGLL